MKVTDLNGPRQGRPRVRFSGVPKESLSRYRMMLVLDGNPVLEFSSLHGGTDGKEGSKSKGGFRQISEKSLKFTND